MRSWCRQFIRNMNISFDKLEMILACYILDTRFSSNWIERFFSRGKNGSSKNVAIGKFSPISKSRKRYWWVSKSRFRVIFPSWSLNFFADVSRSLGFVVFSLIRLVLTGAHQMEPPSPIQALGVNPFPSRFIIRTVPRGDFARRRWEEPITTTKWLCYCTSSRRDTVVSLASESVCGTGQEN